MDVHHIDPWAAVQEHHFDNLIALCPNCHRRADAGEIDRKSLRLYKARLAAAFHVWAVPTYPQEGSASPVFSWSDPAARWRTLAIRRSDLERKYTAEVEYPEFAVVGPGLAALNSVVVDTIGSLVASFERDAVYWSDARPDPIGYEINGSFSVSLVSGTLASIRFGFYTFADSAHGSHWSHVINASLQPFSTLSLRTLFADLSQGLSLVADYCFTELMRPTADGCRDEAWVRAGTRPEEHNFEIFNLTPDGVLFSFYEHQVGPFVLAGGDEVLVPYSVIGSALTEPVASLLNETPN